VVFLTGGDPKSDDNNMKMFHPRCKLMLVTEGGEGCRYYTQVRISFSKHELERSPVMIFFVAILCILHLDLLRSSLLAVCPCKVLRPRFASTYIKEHFVFHSLILS
jgi:hypothetical protein